MNIVTTVASSVEGNTATSGGTITLESADVSLYEPLVDLLLKSKFQLYNVTRQKLSGTVKTLTGISPFMLLKDTKQADKPFVVTGITDNILSDTYDIEINEYDNTTDVNLVEG